MEIDPQFGWAWCQLGELLHERLSRFDEAEQAYRKAIELNSQIRPGPHYAWPWGRLGLLLHEKLGRFEEAEQAYRKAIEIAPQYAWANGALLGLLLRQPERRAEATRFAEAVVAQSPGDPRLLNSLAWKLFETGELPLMERALPWAREAVRIDPDDGNYQHTLASIQCALGNVQEALQSVEKYLADEKTVRDTLEHATNLMVELAARGEGRRALQILLDSPSRDQLEPLAAGIRIFLGEDVTIAAEIKEIGFDVARRIQQRRDALQAVSA
jgi:tetratricopeptide (TPR) repeat protein